MGGIIFDLHGYIEAVRVHTRYSERILWHFNSMLISSHSASSVYQKKKSTIKSRAEMHVKIQKIKSLGVL